MIEVMACDPGGTTGCAYFRFTDDGAVYDWHAFEASPDHAVDWMMSVFQLPRAGKLLVASERFTITTQTAKKSRTDRVDAIEVHGVLRHACRWYGAEFHVQSPGDARGIASNKRLQSQGWWVKGTNGHAIDAIRHVVLCMADGGFPPPWV